MKENSFFYKTYCELSITSNDIELGFITTELSITPDRFHKKGEQTISKNSGSIITKPNNLWAIKTKTSKNELESVSRHIEYFRLLFIDRTDKLIGYKNDDNFEVVFWIWIETDNSGIGLDFDNNEMFFINYISNRVHITFITI